MLAAALVEAATEAGLELSLPVDALESPGLGIAGLVDRHSVLVGSRTLLRERDIADEEITSTSLMGTRGSGEAHVLVAVDGHVAGLIVMAGELRPDAERVVERLRSEGVRHIAMLSGRPAFGGAAGRPRTRCRSRLRRAVTRRQARGCLTNPG